MINTDNCKSYNVQIGEVPEVILPRPDWLAEGERINGVPVDACLAKVIKHLWNNGITTLNCCCGHGGRIAKKPSIILGENEDPVHARKLIAEVDNRLFELKQWKLTNV